MLDITAANTRNLPTQAKPPGPKTYSRKTEAQFAAVATLGQMARDGFEYTVEKCDGRWLWRATDADKIPPDTAAQIKANGGKRAYRLGEKIEPQNSSGKPAHAFDPKGAVPQPPAPEVSPAKPARPVLADLAAKAGWQASDPHVRTVGDAVAEAIDSGVTPMQVATDLAGTDPLDIPPFLRRTKTIDPTKPNHAKPRPAQPDRAVTEGSTKTKTQPQVNKPRTKAPRGVVVGETVAPAPKTNLLKPPTKAEIIRALLTRKEGCTAADILAATGWPSVSVPAMAKAAKFILRKEKDGKTSRYWGVPQ